MKFRQTHTTAVAAAKASITEAVVFNGTVSTTRGACRRQEFSEVSAKIMQILVQINGLGLVQ